MNSLAVRLLKERQFLATKADGSEKFVRFERLSSDGHMTKRQQGCRWMREGSITANFLEHENQ